MNADLEVYRGWEYFVRREGRGRFRRARFVVEYRAPKGRMAPSFVYGNPFQAWSEKRAIAKFCQWVDEDIAFRQAADAITKRLGYRLPPEVASEELRGDA